jgi:hypothetical protein
LGDFQPPIRGSNRRVGVRVFVPAHEYPRKARPSEPRKVGSENRAPDPTTRSALLHHRLLEDQHIGQGAGVGRSPRLCRDRLSALSVSAIDQIGLSTAEALPRPMAPTLPTVGRPFAVVARPVIYRDLPRNYPDEDHELAACACELPCSLAREFGR